MGDVLNTDLGTRRIDMCYYWDLDNRVSIGRGCVLADVGLGVGDPVPLGLFDSTLWHWVYNCLWCTISLCIWCSWRLLE